MKKNTGFISLCIIFLLAFLALSGFFGWWFAKSGKSLAIVFLVIDFVAVIVLGVLLNKEINTEKVSRDDDDFSKNDDEFSHAGSDMDMDFDDGQDKYEVLAAKRVAAEERAADALLRRDEIKEYLRGLDKSSPEFEAALDKFDMADEAAERAVAAARKAAAELKRFS